MGHTPGPWINDRSHPEWERNVVWAGDVVVAHVVDDQHGNANSNAQLIAAAPAMLSALRDIAKCCELRLRKGKDQGDLDTLRACRKAIAKAEGRTT